MLPNRFRLWLVLAGVALFHSTALAFVILDPTVDEDKPDSGKFFGNPYEEEERPDREAAYREYFEDELDPALKDNALLHEVFGPRVYQESFDTDLPGTLREGQWGLRLSPKFGDFFSDPYIRTEVGARYNFSNYFDAFFDVGTYFPNPFDDGDHAGFYNFQVGAKYSWVRISDTTWNMALGFNADMPFSDPPLEILDGYARYEPYIALSHQIPNHPEWLGYLNTTYQFVDESPFRAEPIDPQPKDRLFLRPGLIYYPGGSFRYSMELEYRTNALDFRDQAGPRPEQGPRRDPTQVYRPDNWILAFREVHEVLVYPGVTWFPRKEIRDNLFLPGNWDLGVRLQVPVTTETDEGFGLSVKFRWFYDYRHLLMQDLPGIFRGD